MDIDEHRTFLTSLWKKVAEITQQQDITTFLKTFIIDNVEINRSKKGSSPIFLCEWVNKKYLNEIKDESYSTAII